MHRRVVLHAIVLSLSLLTGCSSGGPAGANSGKATPATGGGASGSSTNPSVLGDLGEFKKIAESTLVLVEKGDTAGAKLRIKDLETAWDQAEETMKPKSEAAWTSIDKAIDHALEKVRVGEDQKGSVSALKVLIVKLSPQKD